MISPALPSTSLLCVPQSSQFISYFLCTPFSYPKLLAHEVLFLPSTDLPNPYLAPWRQHHGALQSGLSWIPAPLSTIATSLHLFHMDDTDNLIPSAQGCREGGMSACPAH